MSQQQQRPPRRPQHQQRQRQARHPQPDPIAVLITAIELKLWREDETTQKILRYLEAWRERTKEALAEGTYLQPSVEASAMKTTEAVAKCQLIADILNLRPRDIAAFYGLDEPREEKTEAKK